jgi:hypothetical protein
MNRRDFLRASSAAALGFGVPAEAFAQARTAPAARWDAGSLHHLLPTVSDSRMLIKASFDAPLGEAPTLRVGDMAVRGQMTDTRGSHWSFDAIGLQPARRYSLSLTSGNGRALAEPWELSTFPSPDDRPQRLRVLFYTCAGGHEAMGKLPNVVRARLLRRALSFAPDAVVANGDHVYWDQLAPIGRRPYVTPEAEKLSGKFDRSATALGSDNETVLKRIGDAQISPLYTTDFRSTPVFFLQDDHDHFDNDEATDEIITFPPPYFHLQLARATQHLYYPEFLPDLGRPKGLPWSSGGDRPPGVSESFGTLRYGRLAEVLLYDVRRTATLAGPSAVFVDLEAEKWLRARSAATEVAHLIHAPSNPPGWTAGKWGEWYPDVLDRSDHKLTVTKPKPYWQSGWLKQHDRLIQAMSAMKGRAPLVISGDLHAIATGRMLRSGALDLTANPVTAALSGPIGTGASGWPSAGFRGTPALPPAHLDMDESVKSIEQNGFLLVDFTPDKMVLRFFKWDAKTQGPEAIDALEPFHTSELTRPA